MKDLIFYLGLALCISAWNPSHGQEAEALKLNNEGVDFLGRGDLPTAIAKLEAAHRADRGNSTIMGNLATAYLKKSEWHIARNELKEAVNWLDGAVSLGCAEEAVKNNLAAGYNDVASIHMREGRWGDAVSLLQTAVSISPGSAVLRNNLGSALYRDNRRDEALVEFRGALGIDHENAMARKMCGVILYWKGDLKGALEDLREAAKLDPSDKEVGELLKKVEKEYEVEKEFDVDTHVNFVVSFDGRKDYRVGRAVIGALEGAWAKVGTDLNFYPREKVAVVIYTGRQFRDLLEKPRNVGGLYDGKIRVPVGGIDTERDLDKLKKILTHEYAHGVVHFLTHNRCPLWLNEGIAEYESETWDRYKEAKIRGAMEKGELIPIAELSNALKNFNSPKIELAYCEAFSVVKFIADRFGVYTLRKMLDGIDAGDGIEKALQKAISYDLERLESDWKGSFK